MPRTLLGADSYKDKDLVEVIRIYAWRSENTIKHVAELIGVSESTMHRWMKNPGDFPLAKLRLIQKKLKIPAAKMAEFLL